MRIGIYAPYLRALGGGEKYILVVLAEALSLPDAEVLLFSPEEPVPDAWERLNVHVDPAEPRLTWTHAPTADVAGGSTRGLDVFVTLQNDVPPVSRAERSFAIVQFPFVPRGLRRRSDLRRPLAALRRTRDERARLDSYDEFVCYSGFVQRFLAWRWGVHDARVIHPPVDIPSAAPAGPRAPHVLSVGRFFRSGHSKKQDVLIRAFRKLWERPGRPDDLRLHLVGGVDAREGAAYLAELRELAEGLPVSFHVGASLATLEDLYARCSLYWHATGHGESELRHPERMEHFGISTVEAMAHGCIALTVRKGGQREVVSDGENGFFWKTPKELAARSSEVLADERRFEPVRERAKQDARRYSTERFRDEVRRTLFVAPSLTTPAGEALVRGRSSGCS